ncbi:unnamed protein product [Bursaphelenchus xylophilus]|uniref:(pine wood nematode) hypothetical protein n=1 Tax=Bursaphelenchus xylophilus TaxID=6326 RepID=A0A1I7SXA4_BURXY|nr:unnamed protein product [Bursaphelenchus xylophilus]CAG9100286.1 unnamed protein product [Bursaphelenchus xylophilus]
MGQNISNVFHCMYFEVYRADDGIRVRVKNYIRSATPMSMEKVTSLYPRFDESIESRLIAPTGLALPAPLQTVFDVTRSENRLREYGAAIIQVLGTDVFSSLSTYLQQAKTLIPVDFDQLCVQIHERCRPLALPGPTLQDPNNIVLNEFTNRITLEAQALQFFLNGEFPTDEFALEQAVVDHEGDEEVQLEQEGQNNTFVDSTTAQEEFRPPTTEAREVRLEDLPSTSRSRAASSVGTQSSYGRSYRPRRIFDPSDTQ